jgi:tRNA A37 threonylcarbamoyladenosine synthetase subunit TsaC/SUA5/YrdC
MLIHIHPTDPQPRLIKQVVETLQNGGIIIYPTDTIYGWVAISIKPKR